jgi:hypothetical protein
VAYETPDARATTVTSSRILPVRCLNLDPEIKVKPA